MTVSFPIEGYYYSNYTRVFLSSVVEHWKLGMGWDGCPGGHHLQHVNPSMREHNFSIQALWGLDDRH